MQAPAEDDFDCVRSCTYVEEAGELAAVVDRVCATRGGDAAAVYSRFHQIVRRLHLHAVPHPCQAAWPYANCQPRINHQARSSPDGRGRVRAAADQVPGAAAAAGPAPGQHRGAARGRAAQEGGRGGRAGRHGGPRRSQPPAVGGGNRQARAAGRPALPCRLPACRPRPGLQAPLSKPTVRTRAWQHAHGSQRVQHWKAPGGRSAGPA